MQTLPGKVQDAHRGLNLVGSVSQSGMLSPYFQLTPARKEAPTRDINHKSLMAISMYIVRGFQEDVPSNYAVFVDFIDPANISATDRELLDFSLSGVTDAVSLQAAALVAINAYIATVGYTITNAIWPFSITVPGPLSYQTIVSQTGTSAPVASGLTPVSSYPSGTTFTWARTGTGVYTLTASTAVFNTSGKTGVFVGPLNNLNASVKAVVTSTTVITVTTAIQSVAALGLLPLTATNTDALLSNTMIYIQTYN